MTTNSRIRKTLPARTVQIESNSLQAIDLYQLREMLTKLIATGSTVAPSALGEMVSTVHTTSVSYPPGWPITEKAKNLKSTLRNISTLLFRTNLVDHQDPEPKQRKAGLNELSPALLKNSN